MVNGSNESYDQWHLKGTPKQGKKRQNTPLMVRQKNSRGHFGCSGENNFAKSISTLLGDSRLVHSILAKNAFRPRAFAQMALGGNASPFWRLPASALVQRH